MESEHIYNDEGLMISQGEEDNIQFGLDPVRDYMAAAGASPLLSLEEEQELAKRVKAGDKKAKDKMICSNLRLVVSIAKGTQTPFPVVPGFDTGRESGAY